MRLAHHAAGVALALAIAAGAGCKGTPRGAADSPTVDLVGGEAYICRRARKPIVLDGKLDEPAWATAQRVDRFQIFRPAGTYVLPTVGRLTWDDDYLYVSFKCADMDVRSASTTHDDYLAAGDVVELYVKFPDQPHYYEFVSAPNGTTFDARWPHRGAGDFRLFSPWESGLRSAATVRGTPDDAGEADLGYAVEMAVPWSAFDGMTGPPADGTTWQFGLFRYDHGASFSEPFLLMSLAASPEHGFHYYENYHLLQFKR